MATRIWPRTLQEIPSILPALSYRTMKVEAFTSAGSSALTSMATDEPDGSRRFYTSSQIPVSFYSERILDPVTISGTITFHLWVNAPATFTGRMRARLYKVTAGGSDVESLICEADALTDIVDVSSAIYEFTGTPTSTVVTTGERMILRLYVTPVLGSFGTGTVTFRYNEDTIGSMGNTWIECTEAIVFYDNAARLNLRRTNANAIGNFFDLLPVLGSSPFTTGIVSSDAGGGEKQYTRTPANSAVVTEVTAAAIALTTNVTTYTSASYTPVANRLYLLPVVHADAAPETTVPTVTTTNGLTFVQVGSSIPFGTIASPGQRLTLFRAMKASGLSAGTHTVTLADAGTGCIAALYEAAGVATTGTNGADAVINIATANADASANPLVTLAAFNHANNGTFACFGSTIATAPTAGAGFTGFTARTIATPTEGAYAVWMSGNDTTADCVLASSAWAAIAVELVAAPGTITALEFITGRVKAPGFYVASNLNVGASWVWGYESHALANCAPRVKLFKRTPDGTETQVYIWSGGEYPITPVSSAFNAGTATPAGFLEDDRLILRVYIYNIGTMGGGYTCTLDYDGNTLNVDGNSYLNLLEAPQFKAEGDPAGTSRIEGGQTMSGIGN